MSMVRPVKMRLTVGALAVLIPVSAGVLTYRTYRHQQLNQDLILAILRGQDAQALTLIDRGAGGDARTSDVRRGNGLIRTLLDRLTHRQLPAGADEAEGVEDLSALLLYYQHRIGLPADEASGPAERNDYNESLPLALLRAGAPIQESDSHGTTAMFWATLLHQHRVLRTLINLGARPDAKQDMYVSPLFVADTADAAALLDAGAGVDTHNLIGQTPVYSPDAALVELLISRGANIEISDCGRQTPLINACMEGWGASAMVLLAHGAIVAARDIHGATALLRASAHCSGKVVQQLVKQGADVRAVDHDGNTALMLSLTNPDRGVFSWLLEQNIDVNARGYAGNTALTIADQLNRKGMPWPIPNRGRYGQAVSALIAHGARHVTAERLWYGEPY